MVYHDSAFRLAALTKYSYTALMLISVVGIAGSSILLNQLVYSQLINDRDSDGVEDQYDPCPDEYGTNCLPNTDGDDLPNYDDLCPDDPYDACVADQNQAGGMGGVSTGGAPQSPEEIQMDLNGDGIVDESENQNQPGIGLLGFCPFCNFDPQLADVQINPALCKRAGETMAGLEHQICPVGGSTLTKLPGSVTGQFGPEGIQGGFEAPTGNEMSYQITGDNSRLCAQLEEAAKEMEEQRCLNTDPKDYQQPTIFGPVTCYDITSTIRLSTMGPERRCFDIKGAEWYVDCPGSPYCTQPLEVPWIHVIK